jgi:hypothetical protein
MTDTVLTQWLSLVRMHMHLCLPTSVAAIRVRVVVNMLVLAAASSVLHVPGADSAGIGEDLRFSATASCTAQLHNHVADASCKRLDAVHQQLLGCNSFVTVWR